MNINTPRAIDDLAPGEGGPDRNSLVAEFGAWNMRKRLPSEHAHRPVLRWPQHVSDVIDISEATLAMLRSEGDHPRLFAIGRALFTTPADLLAWFERHELASGSTVRRATVPKGTKLAGRVRRKAAAEVAAP